MKQIFILALSLPTLCTTTHAQWRYLDVLNNEEVTCLTVSGGSVYAGTLYGSRRAQVNDLVHSNDNQYAATRNGVHICTDNGENWTHEIRSGGCAGCYGIGVVCS